MRVYQDQIVGQSFVSNHNNFKTVVLYLRNRELKNNEEVIFSLADLDFPSIIMRQVVVKGQNIGDGTTVRFDFPPIADSRGRKYLVSIKSPTSTWENGIEVGYSPKDLYPYGQALAGDKFIDGDLFFITYFRPEPGQLVKNSLAVFSARLTHDLVFIVPFFFLITILGILAVWLFLKSE